MSVSGLVNGVGCIWTGRGRGLGVGVAGGGGWRAWKSRQEKGRVEKTDSI